jgi:hypothetical protein
MKEYYYLMAENGYKPKYKHETIQSAIAEAQRLIVQRPDIGKIEVLKSLGFVQWKEVPVTKKEICIDIESSELPF